jgi:hypothetical protein
MDDYIIFTLGLIVGYWLGKLITNALNTISFREILKDLGVTQQQMDQLRERALNDSSEQQLEEIEVKLEQHQGQIYAFRVDNDQFLGQGPDRESLLQRLTETMTDVRIIIAKEHGADLIYRPK